MILLHLVRSARDSLIRHKLRSGLTMLGMVFGVGAVVAMLAIGGGAQENAIKAIRDMGIDNLILVSRKPSVSTAAGEVKRKGREVQSYGLTFLDCDRLAAVIPGVQQEIRIRELSQKVWCGNRRIEARIIATDPAYAAATHLTVARGRFLAEADRTGHLPVAVLGADLVRDLFPTEDALGGVVRIDQQWFQVVGLLASRASAGGISSPAAEELNRTIIIPATTAQSRFGLLSVQRETGSWQISRLEVARHILVLDRDQDILKAKRLARQVLDLKGPRRDVEVLAPLELLEEKRRVQRLFTIIMTSIASISLLVGGIGIMNIMLATVTERTREIGIRRAIGARRRDIMAQFLVETGLLSLSGGLIGLVLGIGGAVAVTSLAGWPTVITVTAVTLPLAICLMVGLVFGLYPARKAAYMQPVEALRGA